MVIRSPGSGLCVMGDAAHGCGFSPPDFKFRSLIVAVSSLDIKRFGMCN